jgi:hypothetical protein
LIAFPTGSSSLCRRRPRRVFDAALSRSKQGSGRSALARDRLRSSRKWVGADAQESPSGFIAGKRAPTNNQFISVSYVLFDRSEFIRE